MPTQTNPAGTAPIPSPLDGRITSLPQLTAVIGGELMEITSPGNAQFGNSYQVTTNALAAYVNGILPIVPSLRAPLMDEPISVVGTSLAYSREDHVHPSDTSRAPLDSPIFTGNPQVPTASLGTSSPQIASCEFVETAVANIIPPNPSTTPPAMDGIQTIGTSLDYARADHVHPTDNTRAPLNSPAFTGVPSTATTPPSTDNSTNLATTAFVATAVATMPTPATTPPPMDSGTTGSVGTTTKVFALSDHYHPSDTSRAPFNSPAFTGIPTAPTAGAGTGTNQLATTLFVGTAVTNAGAGTTDFPIMDGASAVVGAKTTYARADHVHPSDATKVNDAPNDGNTYARKNQGWVIPNGMLITFTFFNTSATITIPANATTAMIELWGGTGGSGGAATNCVSGGTGAPGYLRKYLTGLTAGQTLALVIGAAGAAGTSAPSSGGPGGASTLSSGTQTIPATLTAGGSGATSAVSGSGAAGAGSSGGASSNGDHNVTGQSGSSGQADSTNFTIFVPGRGGAGVYVNGADGVVAGAGQGGHNGGCNIWWYA